MKKINVAELLRNCPKGMELDCTMFDDVKFSHIQNDEAYPIVVTILDTDKEVLTAYGTWIDKPNAKCVILPKGKTTWEGFVPPCKFKDGDIISNGYLNTICIFRGEGSIKGTIDFYCGIGNSDILFIKDIKNQDGHFGEINEYNFATEEEKQKLFQAIKDNGYKWNPETNTLEKLIQPKFKVGDKIVKKNGVCVPILITKVSDEFYYSNTESSVGVLSISEQDNYELVQNKFDINTLVPFDSRVLIRDNVKEKWYPGIWGYYDNDTDSTYPYKLIGVITRYCIPYEGNEHLLGTTNDCDEFYKTWK